MKPLRVHPEWIEYAHGPGADEGQPRASALVALIVGDKPVLVDKPELVAEVVSVAELYDGHSSVQDDDRLWFRAYPGNLIRRGRKWLRGAT